MPTSISVLTSVFNLTVSQTVKWGTEVLEKSHGIYIISLYQHLELLPKNKSFISLSNSQIKHWMQNAPSLTLNGKNPTIDDLRKHLSKFWMQDESILYIGKADKQSLQKRVSQFYHHHVGKKSPHKGGYWLKLLSDISSFYIHILPSDNSHEIEEQMLQYFIENASEDSKSQLIDKDLCLPFANLQLRSGVIKKHGLKKHYQ